MRIADDLDLKFNYRLIFRERGKLVCQREGHNIIVDSGRQFLCRVITASAFAGAGFTRTVDEVIRYVGFGIGGSRQTAPSASAAPYSVDYPGTNVQTDADATVVGLERPVRVTAAPLWMQQVAAPGTFTDPPSAVATTFISLFGTTEISYGGYTSVPISEIGLFKSSADPAEENGGAGEHLVAYDTFDTVHKTGIWSLECQWSIRM